MISNGVVSTGAPAAPLGELSEVLRDLDRIANLQEPVLRNLLITQRYHDLMKALGAVVGCVNANWSTFATWASKTAGESIRGEEVPRELTELLKLEESLTARFDRLARAFPWVPFRVLDLDLDLFDVVRAMIAEVSEQIAEGNLKVFAELAPLFARFASEFSDPSRRTRENLDAFLKRLRPGPPERDGQDLLVKAFTAYFEASRAQTTKECAELVLYGNLLIGLHEQTRLQPNIRAALDAPLSPRVYAALRASTKLLLRPIFGWLFKSPLKAFLDALVPAWERLATRYLMRLSLPGGSSIPLGSDIVVPRNPFPPDLDPLRDPDLIELVRRYDSDLESTRGSGAVNWCELSDRMRFICDLFRCRQQDPTLFEQPFTAAQRALFEAGTVPKDL